MTDTEVMKPPLSTTIRLARHQAGLTQTELAGYAGVGVQTLRDIEQGTTTDPRASTLTAILAACDDRRSAADLPRCGAADLQTGA